MTGPHILALIVACLMSCRPAHAQATSPIATQSTPSESDVKALTSKVDALAVAFAEFRMETLRDREALVLSVQQEGLARTKLAEDSFKERTALALRQAEDQRWELADVVSILVLGSILAAAASWLNSAFIASKTAPLEKQLAEQKLREEGFQAESRSSRTGLGHSIESLRGELNNQSGLLQSQISAMSSKQDVNIARLSEAKTELETQKRALEAQIANSNNEFYRWIAILWEQTFTGKRFPDRAVGQSGIAHHGGPTVGSP